MPKHHEVWSQLASLKPLFLLDKRVSVVAGEVPELRSGQFQMYVSPATAEHLPSGLCRAEESARDLC